MVKTLTRARPQTATRCRVCSGAVQQRDGRWGHVERHGLTPHPVKLAGRWHQCRIVREVDGRQCQGHEPHTDHVDAAGSPIAPGTGILWP